MIDQAPTTTSAASLRQRLQELAQERAIAGLTGLEDNELYMADLREEIAAVRSAYVGAAVTEIAGLRAAFDGPLFG